MTTQKSTLHLLQKSPFNSDALASCLRVCGPDDAIVLMQDGVYAATQHRDWPCQKVVVMSEDLAERGIADSMQPEITRIDYTELVALCSEHRHSQSWF